MNWLDITLIVILFVALVMGIVRGLVRQVIGIAAVIAGLVLAVLYYRGVGRALDSFIHNSLFSDFLGFILVFGAVVAAGSVLGYLLTKAMKGPLALVNRLSGGAFGFIKGVLICGVLVFALTTFQVARPALATSRLAPVCFSITRAAVNLIPKEVRDKFESSYKEIRKGGGGHGKKI